MIFAAPDDSGCLKNNCLEKETPGVNPLEKVSGFSTSAVTLYIFLFFFCLLAWWTYVRHIDLIVAWQGFSPIHWVYQTYQSASFAKDFPCGVQNLGKSAFMHIYSFAYNYVGMRPETLLPLMMGVEIAVLGLAVHFFCRVVFPEAHPIVPTLTVVLMIAGYARYLNLAMIGQPNFIGKYNNIADALRILSIVMMLRKRLVFAAFLLAVTFILHPNMALTGGVFLMGMLLAVPRGMFDRRLLIGVGLFLLIACSWIFLMFDFSNFAGGRIPRDMWFKLTMLGSNHWYPIEFGTFTFRYQTVFIKFLSFSLLLVFYATGIKPIREIDKRMLGGFAAMVVVVVAGVVFSALKISPMLVKLHLHRANDLIVLGGLVYVVKGLWGEIESSILWKKIVAAVVLISPFGFIPEAYPLVLSAVITAPAWVAVIRGKSRGIGDICVLAVFAGIVLTIVSYYVTKVGAYQYIPSYVLTGMSLKFFPLGQYFRDYWSTAWSVPFVGSYHCGIAALLVVIPLTVKLAGRKALRAGVAVIFFVVAVCWLGQYGSSKSTLEMFRGYKEVQLWARKNTANNALFMVDPTIYYGWRDYSRRSSFGNLYEWIHNWAYGDDVEIYREGMKRFGEFSVDLNEYIKGRPNIDDFSRLSCIIQDRYYSLGDEWRMKLAERYEIDYFVVMKDNLAGDSSLPMVYENAKFAVLSSSQEGTVE